MATFAVFRPKPGWKLDNIKMHHCNQRARKNESKITVFSLKKS